MIIMKRFATVLFCLFVFNSFAQTENFKAFYKSNKNKAEVSLNIPSFLANLFIDNDDLGEFKVFLKKARSYKIMVFNDHKSVAQKDFEKFARKNKLKTLIQVKEGNEKVLVYFKETKNRIKEIIVNVNDNNEEMVLIGVKTNLTINELSDMVKATSKQNSVAFN